MPDTVSDLSQDRRNKVMARTNTFHNKSEIDSKSKEFYTSIDESVIDKVADKINNAESTEPAQKLYDDCHRSLNNLHVGLKENVLEDRHKYLQGLDRQKNYKTNCLDVEKKYLDEKDRINDYYNLIVQDNNDYTSVLKGTLNYHAEGSNLKIKGRSSGAGPRGLEMKYILKKKRII